MELPRSGLLTEAAIVLYDGSPGHPDMEVLWDLAERAGDHHLRHQRRLHLSLHEGRGQTGRRARPGALRAVGSTGSPLAPEGFDWIYEELGEDTWLFSISGGTDLCTAFVGGVRSCRSTGASSRARALGAKVEAWEEAGEPLIGAVASSS